jgi:ribose transport system permease protein
VTTQQLHVPRIRSTTGAPIADLLQRYALLILLAGEVALFLVVVPEQFGSAENLQSIAVAQSVVGILMLGLLIPLISGEFDVSLAGVFTTAMLVAAIAIDRFGWPVWVALVAAVVISAGIGAMNAFVVIVTRADSLVVTLGVLTILRGVDEALTQGTTITLRGDIGQDLRNAVDVAILGIPLPVVLFAVIAAVIWYLTEHTPAGRYLYAIGGSLQAARLAGVPARKLRILAFTAGGALAGFAGVLQLAKSSTATASFGAGYLFPALAAAFLGAVAFRIGSFNVRGAITALFLLAAGVTGIRMLGAPLWIDGVFNGAALILAVAIVRGIRKADS